MEIFKKNIWTLFFITAFFCTLLLVSGISIKKNALLKENKKQQLYLVNVFQHNLLAQFIQQEFLLDVIAQQYLQEEKIAPQRADFLLRKNKQLSSLALFSPEGALLFSSRHLRNKEEINAPTAEKQWFKQAQKSNRMVIGQPYLSARGVRVIPLAKRVLNKQGKTSAIISSELNLESIEKLWQGDYQHQSTLQVTQDKSYSHIIDINLNGCSSFESTLFNKFAIHRFFGSTAFCGKANNHQNPHLI